MCYIIARKPSGVFYVATLHEEKEWVLYELAAKKRFKTQDDADAECRKMNRERIKRCHEKKKAQMEMEFGVNEKGDGMYE